eukprot:TRINITY_DN48228_c0_g1_i1.p1 TRINITY_DN48228_c0_g1~~TRINITY_DN48228_c0_g1_i1.p1  ORF type:complete len:1434 (+),score=233.49 TRINITY_DN48228_c0_g1_i1:86-4303(+)
MAATVAAPEPPFCPHAPGFPRADKPCGRRVLRQAGQIALGLVPSPSGSEESGVSAASARASISGIDVNPGDGVTESRSANVASCDGVATGGDVFRNDLAGDCAHDVPSPQCASATPEAQHSQDMLDELLLSAASAALAGAASHRNCFDRGGLGPSVCNDYAPYEGGTFLTASPKNVRAVGVESDGGVDDPAFHRGVFETAKPMYRHASRGHSSSPRRVVSPPPLHAKSDRVGSHTDKTFTDDGLRQHGDGGVTGGGTFLDRLRLAHAEAVAKGDFDAAAAVSDAMRAEGGSIGPTDGGTGRGRPTVVPPHLKRCGSVQPTPSQPPVHHPCQAQASCPLQGQPPPQPRSRLPRPCRSSPPSARPTDGASSNIMSSSPNMKRRSVANSRASRYLGSPEAQAQMQSSGSSKVLLPAPLHEAKTAEPLSPNHQSAWGAFWETSLDSHIDEPPKRQFFGGLCDGDPAEGVSLLRAAADAELRRQRGCGGNVFGKVDGVVIQRESRACWSSDHKGWEGSPCSESLDAELPASDLSSTGRAAVRAWACGRMGSHRCLLEVAATNNISMLQPPAPTHTGRASWAGLLALVGLAGGEELFATFGLRSSVFTRTPVNCLQEAYRAVKEEAGVSGPVTMEELNLGLRAIELRSRGEGVGNGFDGGGDASVVAFRLQAQTWRELFRCYLGGRELNGVGGDDGDVGACLQRHCPARTLRRLLSIGPQGVEREAREESHDGVRELPPGWQEARTALVRMARLLREELEAFDVYGAYAVLGVEPDASDVHLKRAYRELCLRHHPDKGGDTVTFQSVQQAHEKILEERRRGIRPPPIPKARRPTTPPEPQRPRRPPSPRWASSPTVDATAEASPRASSESASRGRQPSSQRRCGRWSPRPQSPKSQETGVIEVGVILEIDNLCTRATEGTERAQAASDAVHAACRAIEAIIAHVRTDDDHQAACEAFRGLVGAVHAVAEGVQSSSGAAGDTSRLLTGALQESSVFDRALLAAAHECDQAASMTSDAATACEAAAEELSETIEASGTTFTERGVESESSECMAFACQLLVSASNRCQETARAGVHAAGTASRAVGQARLAARACGSRRSGGGSGSGEAKASRARSSPPRPRKDDNYGDANPKGVEGQDVEGSLEGDEGENVEDEKPVRRDEDEGCMPGEGGSAAGQQRRCGRPPQPRRRPPPPPSSPPCASGAEDTSGGGDGPSGGGGCGAPFGSARARSSSAGARGRREALIQRRVEAFVELSRLNSEASALQRRWHDALRRCPLLLPQCRAVERARVFGAAAEMLHETARDLVSRGPTALPDLAAWLSALGACTSGGGPEIALCDVRTACLRLAAVVDVNATVALIEDHFLPHALQALQTELSIADTNRLRATISRAAESLGAWVATRSPPASAAKGQPQ